MPEDYDAGDYELWLQHPGDRHAAVMQTLRRLQPGVGLTEVQDLVRSAPCWLADYGSYAEVMAARRLLEEVGAVTEVLPQRLLFPPGLLGANPQDDHRDANVHCSRHLRALREPALEAWAATSGTPEVYRFLYFPTFDPVTIVRLWQTAAGKWECEAVLSTGLGGYAPGLVQQRASWQPSAADVAAFLSVIAETTYWSAPWPRTDESGWRVVLDGAYWVFEAWRAGCYQGQFIHSPGDDPLFAAQRRLGQSFFHLLGDRLGPIRIY